MKNQITIREANSKTDTAAFWEQLHSTVLRNEALERHSTSVIFFLTRRTKASSIF